MRVARVRRASPASALPLQWSSLASRGRGSEIGRRKIASTAAAESGLPVVATQAGVLTFLRRGARSADALRDADTVRGYRDKECRFDSVGDCGVDTWLASGRRVWLDGYRRQLHAAAWSAVVDSLRTLPPVPSPSDDYGRDYALLKAYLVMTNEPSRSTPEFLAPVLLASWARGQTLDADVTALARRQFEFYATELARQNPWPQGADANVVRRSRDFLRRFSGSEQIYQSMLAQANKAAPPARLAELVPTAAGVIAAPNEVPGAFTAPGWAQMQQVFQNADPYFEGEQWVVGDSTAALTQDRDAVLAQLRQRYRNEYIQRWRAFVRATSVVRSAAARDAAQKLGILSGPQSPLLATLALVARSTAVDSAMAAAFQPVHAVTPPGPPDKFVSDANHNT